MFNVEIDDRYIVTQEGTSEGTQIKYKKDDYWYKLDRDGNEFVIVGEDLLARCILHEYDHLEGILFIDKSADGKIYDVEKEED